MIYAIECNLRGETEVEMIQEGKDEVSMKQEKDEVVIEKTKEGRKGKGKGKSD